MVARAIELNDSSLRALLMYVSLAKTPAAALQAAQQACEVAPDDSRAQAARRWAEQRMQDAQRTKNVPPASTSSHVVRWRSVRVVASALILLVVLGVATIAGFTYWQQQTAKAAPDPLQTALARAEAARGLGDHEAAIRFLSQAHDLAPDDDGVAYSLAQEHVARSTELLNAGTPDAALPHLKAAYDLRPEEEPIVREYQALLAYVAGREAHAKQNWDRVVEALLPLHQLDRDYLDTETLLRDALLVQRQSERELRANGRRALRQMRGAQPGRLACGTLEPEPPSSLPGQASTDMGLPPLEPVTNKRSVENARRLWQWAEIGTPVTVRF